MSLAIALPALMGVFGVAIDYGNLFLIRTGLQTAVDGAVIFAAKQYSLASTKDSDIAATVKTYLDGQLKTEEKLGDFAFTTTTANAKTARSQSTYPWPGPRSLRTSSMRW